MLLFAIMNACGSCTARCLAVSTISAIALQRTEVQILSEILESTKASNATTSEQLDALKESVDTIQKEISESKNNESEN